VLTNNNIDILIITAPLDEARFRQTAEIAFSSGALVSYVPSHTLLSDAPLGYLDVDGVLLASLGKPPRRVVLDLTKRLFDLVGSALLMVLSIPIFGIIAIITKFDSPGPVLFRQKRAGLGGNLFEMYKFRTMQMEASPYEFSPKNPNDSRITRLGKFLRRTSLDELPQLFNVLRGDMSLVGPRPEMPFIVEQYTQKDSERLQVKPGLTGLWQLSGDRAFLIHENLEYDLYYIQHRNFFMDLAILLHTSIFAMRGI
jgi:lipopolysaccharide/colanic/teichoic acid biosynthesis glycosyltransferase